MSRRRASLSPTLFPFLAVLVCTLGTLILLLALVAVDAEKSAKAAVKEQAEAAVLATEEEVWEAERLIAHRDSQTAQLQRKHGELAHLEDHICRLRDQLHALRTEIEAATSPEDNPSDKTNEALAELQKAIETESKRIETLREEHEGRPPRVVIVPYQGTNGTDRRPIYIECTDSAIVIQPEGVQITASTLDGPIGPGNPLDAALRAVRTHWQKIDPQAPPPYPLLLVRPDGVHAYATARIAMETWDDQFGYELIPKDLQLAYPPRDENLKSQIAQAIDDAVLRNQARLAAGPARWKGFTGPQRGIPGNVLGTGGLRSGNTRSPSSQSSPEGELAYGSGSSSSNIGDSTPSGPARTFGPSPSPFPSAGDGAGRGTNDFSIRSDNLSTTGSSIFGGGIGEEDFGETIGGGGPGSESLPGNTTRSRSPIGENSSFAGSPGDPAFSANSGNPGFSAPFSTPVANDPQGLGQGGASTPAMTDRDIASGSSSQRDRSSSRGNPNNFETAHGETGQGDSDGGELDSESGVSEIFGTFESRSMAGGLSGGTMASGNAGAGSSSAMSSDGAPPSLDASGAPTPGMSGPSSSAPADPNAKTFSEAMNQRQAAPPPGTPKIRPNGMPPSLSSGNNWALPGSVVGQRGATIVRQMEAVVQSDRFILQSDGSRGSETQEFMITDGLVEKAVLDLGTAIRDRVIDWGPAMLNGRWSPVLNVRVSPGGESRFKQLEMLMRNSGVRVERAKEVSR